MAIQSATTITAPSSDADLTAMLNYHDRKYGPIEVLNFMKPGTEAKFDELQNAIETGHVVINNIRGKECEYKLETNGFEYVKDEVKGLDACKTEDEIRDLLLPATEELVKRVTGAHKTIIFTHRIRSLAEDPSRRADNKAPAHSVHTDFTPAGARNMFETTIRDPEERAAIEAGRILAINVWRPLKTIKKDPLAMLNWKSLDASKDILPSRMVLNENFWSELGKVQHSDKHEWFYMEGQTPSEPVIFKQYDSKVEGGMTLPHSAFVDPKYIDEEPRQSIEIKMFAFVKE